MITFTELVDELLRSTSRRRRNNKSRGDSRQNAKRNHGQDPASAKTSGKSREKKPANS
jgi:hypothetical protein